MGPWEDAFQSRRCRIKVFGVGGGGCNAVDRMIAADMAAVEFIAVNTDYQALEASRAPVRLQIGQVATRGLGSGSAPVVGQQAAEESQELIREQLRDTDMCFIAAGMGGGTGTGAAPIIADLARDMGVLSVAVVTRPFAFEGNYRRKVAEAGLAQLRATADTLIVIANDRLLQLAVRNTSLAQAFQGADSVLHQGVQALAELVAQRGLINVDFADLRAVLAEAGNALMGVGYGSGPNRTLEAVHRAIASPLLDVSLAGARGVILNFTGGEDLGLLEVQAAAEQVARAVDPEANIIFGAVIDPGFAPGRVKITLVATNVCQPAPAPARSLPRLQAAATPPADLSDMLSAVERTITLRKRADR